MLKLSICNAKQGKLTSSKEPLCRSISNQEAQNRNCLYYIKLLFTVTKSAALAWICPQHCDGLSAWLCPQTFVLLSHFPPSNLPVFCLHWQDLKPVDVTNKRSLWENKGATPTKVAPIHFKLFTSWYDKDRIPVSPIRGNPICSTFSVQMIF